MIFFPDILGALRREIKEPINTSMCQKKKKILACVTRDDEVLREGVYP